MNLNLRACGLVVWALLLAACAGEPELSRPDVGPQQERTVLAALTKVSATDQQRIAVLNAYDSTNGRLRELATQSRQIIGRWHQLDRTAPDFSTQIDALAAQWASVNAAEMKARAAFEQGVAASLSPKQWNQWQDFMSSAAAERRYEGFGDDDGGFRRGP